MKFERHIGIDHGFSALARGYRSTASNCMKALRRKLASWELPWIGRVERHIAITIRPEQAI